MTITERWLDDFVMNNSYDAWDAEYNENMKLWEEYCYILASEKET